MLKVLFGTFAAPGDIAQNLRASIKAHEMRLLAYRETAHYIPAQGTFPQHNRRLNPYAAESEEDSYFMLIIHFAIDFEKTYIRWLYEALEMVEQRQSAPGPATE